MGEFNDFKFAIVNGVLLVQFDEFRHFIDIGKNKAVTEAGLSVMDDFERSEFHESFYNEFHFA